MDIRPLIHFWINKPDTWDDGSTQQQTNAKISSYGQVALLEEFFDGSSNSRVRPTWGDPFSMIELWMDLDKFIENLTSKENLLFASYLHIVLMEDNWEEWPEPPKELTMVFQPFVDAMV